MKLETILDAMIGVKYRIDDLSPRREWKKSWQTKRQRQYKAFRARILRMFVANWRLPWEAAEKRAGELELQLKSERDLHELTVAEKDAEIARLRRWIKALQDRPTIKAEGWEDSND